MKKRSLALLLCLLVCQVCQSVFAADETPYAWQFAGWEGGGAFPALEIDKRNPGRVYLGSDVSGIYRSDDYGDVWIPSARGLGSINVAVIAIAPSDSNIVYAGTKGGLYVSKDAAKTWQAADTLGGKIKFARPKSYRSIAVSRTGAANVCVGSSKGTVACSEDFGASWRVLGPDYGPFGESTVVAALGFNYDETVLWAAGEKGLAFWEKSGSRWTPLTKGPKPVTDFVLLGSESQTMIAAGGPSLWISEDNGEGWWPTAPMPRGNTLRVAARRDENGLWLGAIWIKDWDGGVVTSTDRGQTWTNSDRFLRPDPVRNPTRAWMRSGGRTLSLKMAADPLILLRTDWWGIWRSDDGGLTWKEKIQGAPNTVGSDVTVTPAGRIYVATMDDGLLSSTDGGVTYKALFPVSGYSDDKNGHVWRVAVAGKNHATVIATSSPWGDALNQVIVSQDGGETFQIVRAGLPDKRPKINTLWGQGFPRALAVDPYEPKRVYLGIDGDDGGGFFISDDGGMTWQHPERQPPSLRIYNGLAVDPTDTTRLLWATCDANGGVFLSRNGGKDWEHVLRQTSCIFDVAIAKDGTMYAGGDNKGPVLYVSRDQGSHWELLKRFEDKGVCEAITPHPTQPKRLAISLVQWGEVSGGKVHMTDDGEYWRDITGDLPEGTGAAAMTFGPDGWLYLSRYAGSVYRVKLND